jgi:hypothetical protein
MGWFAGRLTQTKLLQLGLAWKGNAGLLGWGSVAADGRVCLGHRYERILKKPKETVALLRHATTRRGTPRWASWRGPS